MSVTLRCTWPIPTSGATLLSTATSLGLLQRGVQQCHNEEIAPSGLEPGTDGDGVHDRSFGARFGFLGVKFALRVLRETSGQKKVGQKRLSPFLCPPWSHSDQIGNEVRSGPQKLGNVTPAKRRLDCEGAPRRV